MMTTLASSKKMNGNKGIVNFRREMCRDIEITDIPLNQTIYHQDKNLSALEKQLLCGSLLVVSLEANIVDRPRYSRQLVQKPLI
jgi:hypothetical protein